MIKLFSFLAFVTTVTIFSQTPLGFNYQATIRNSTGYPVLKKNVLLKFNLLKNSPSGKIVYSENQTATTDDLGTLNLVIGQGIANKGTFSSIDWGIGNYYLDTEINTGTGFVSMGNKQMASIDFALFAKSVGNLNLPIGTDVGDILTWNGKNWITIPNQTNSHLPLLTSVVASRITVSSALSGGTITSDGGYGIITKGLCWSTNPNPTTNDFITNNGSGASSFTSAITNLLPETTYYYRAYASNTAGIGYGMTFTFKTNPFSEVIIGTQIWESTNLDVNTYRDGTEIPQVTDPTQWASLTTGAWCYYNNDSATGAIYGKLYNWYALAGIYDAASLATPTLRKQFAPIGWHVPSDTEWTILYTYLGGETLAGGKMKETGIEHWASPNTSAANSSGFKGLPGGYRNYSGVFNSIGYNGYWWSSTENGTSNVWYRYLYYNYGVATSYYFDKAVSFSVRCIRD